MKYLISFNTSIVNQEQASEWGVDRVLILGGNLSADLSNLPQENQLVFFVPTTHDYSNSLSYGCLLYTSPYKFTESIVIV